MTSSFFTFDLRYDLDIQCIHSLGTGHAHVQISGLYYVVNRSYAFSVTEGKFDGISNKRPPNVAVLTAQNTSNLHFF